MKLLSAIGGGVAGAAVLTLLHQTIKSLTPNAPRMDLLGMEVISKTMEKTGSDVPGKEELYDITLVGDMISNSLYYSMAGIGSEKQAIARGALLGLAAGFGAVYLPKPLGLNPDP